MKKSVSMIITLALTLLNTPSFACDDIDFESPYEGNEGCESPYSPPVEQNFSSTNRSKTRMSMLGWGICISIGIALLSGFVHQSKGSNQNATPEPSKL